MLFIREKMIQCGNYVELDIIPRTDIAERAVRGQREPKRKLSRTAQNNLNNRNSARSIAQLANGNFENYNDFWVTFTYKRKFHPKSLNEAEKEITKHIARLNYRYKKAKQELKYILVTEYEMDEQGNQIKQFHHHLILNGGISRDEIEECWSKGRGKKKEKIGRVNCRRLQFDDNGLVGIAEYITKPRFGKRGRKKWSSSRNLKRPTLKNNDYKYTPRQLEKMGLSNDEGRERLEKIYNRYHVVDIVPRFFEDTGWHFYLRMWKKKGSGFDGEESY